MKGMESGEMLQAEGKAQKLGGGKIGLFIPTERVVQD